MNPLKLLSGFFLVLSACGVGDHSTTTEDISNWTADYNQTSVGGGQTVHNHVSYSPDTGNVLIAVSVFENGAYQNPSSVIKTAALQTRDKINEALETIKFKNIEDRYDSTSIWADVSSMQFEFTSSGRTKTTTVTAPDAGPASIQSLYSIASSLNF